MAYEKYICFREILLLLDTYEQKNAPFLSLQIVLLKDESRPASVRAAVNNKANLDSAAVDVYYTFHLKTIIQFVLWMIILCYQFIRQFIIKSIHSLNYTDIDWTRSNWLKIMFYQNT